MFCLIRLVKWHRKTLWDPQIQHLFPVSWLQGPRALQDRQHTRMQTEVGHAFVWLHEDLRTKLALEPSSLITSRKWIEMEHGDVFFCVWTLHLGVSHHRCNWRISESQCSKISVSHARPKHALRSTKAGVASCETKTLICLFTAHRKSLQN